MRGRKWIDVCDDVACQSRKSDSRRAPEVRMRRSGAPKPSEREVYSADSSAAGVIASSAPSSMQVRVAWAISSVEAYGKQTLSEPL